MENGAAASADAAYAADSADAAVNEGAGAAATAALQQMTAGSTKRWQDIKLS